MSAAAPAPGPEPDKPPTSPEPENDSATSPSGPDSDVRMTIWEHLEELRSRIIKAALGVVDGLR